MNDFSLPKKFNWQLASLPIDTVVQEGIIVPSSTPLNGDVYITTGARKTIVQLGYINSSVYTYIQFHLANPNKQLIGDQIILISQPNTTVGDIDYCFPNEYFYITQCGGSDTPPCLYFSETTQERDVSIFTYDGEKFCNTADNC